MRLDLSDNPLTEEVASELASCLAQQPNLRHLNLNDTGLLDEGVQAVCKALAGSAPQLETLELALNEITPSGVRYVVMAIANKQQLKKWVGRRWLAGWWQQHGDGGVVGVDSWPGTLRACVHVEFKTLVRQRGAFKQQPVFWAARCSVVVCSCRLNLRENELEDEGAVTLARGLATLPGLQVRVVRS